jgi:hypothetical protein
VVKCNEALSGTVTHELVPSNESAAPCLPEETQVVFFVVPVLPLPESSVAPAALSNEYAATSPGVAAAALPAEPAGDSTTIVAMPQRNTRRRTAIALPP